MTHQALARPPMVDQAALGVSEEQDANNIPAPPQ